MGWIDDDLDELKRLQQSKLELQALESSIRVHAATIFENLWEEMVSRIEEAAAKGRTSIITNGAPYERKLIVPQVVKRGQSYAHPKEYVLSLAKDQQSFLFKGPERTIILPLDLGEDKVVRIKHDSELKTVPDAAKSLLRPLLFPELYDLK